MPSPIAAAQEALEPVLGGRYRLVRRIATGGMGTVFEADDLWLHRRVAVKLLRDELVDDPRVRRRFEHEAQLAAAVRHRGVAQVHDFVVEPATPDRGPLSHGRAFLVMELVDGEPLSTVLRHRHPMPMARRIDIILQVGEALAAAHRCGVVHRDVKPANILLGEDGRVTLTDFGVATSADPRLDLTAEHGLTYATPSHMSPEQATGGPVGPASDVYSLGVVAHELLTGRPPFQGTTPAALAFAHVHTLPPPLPEDVPAHVREAVMAALAKEPGERPQDAASFVRMVRGATDATQRLTVPVSGSLPVAAPGTRHRGSSPAARPRRGRAGAVSAALAALLTAVVLVAGANGGPDDRTDPVTTDRPATSVPGAATPTVLTVASTTPPTTAAAPVPAGKGNGKGHGKGKAKG